MTLGWNAVSDSKSANSRAIVCEAVILSFAVIASALVLSLVSVSTIRFSFKMLVHRFMAIRMTIDSKIWWLSSEPTVALRISSSYLVNRHPQKLCTRSSITNMPPRPHGECVQVERARRSGMEAFYARP